MVLIFNGWIAEALSVSLKGLKETESIEKSPTRPYLFLIICQIPDGKSSVHFVPALLIRTIVVVND